MSLGCSGMLFAAKAAALKISAGFFVTTGQSQYVLIKASG
jgi:hypothetical protein